MLETVHLEYTFQSIVYIFEMLQASIAGLFLIILNNKKNRSSLFLGVFLLLFSLQRVPAILTELNAFEQYPFLHRLPLDFIWLILPVFYIYTQQISIFLKQKTRYWILIPGIIVFLFELIFLSVRN